MKKTKQPGPTNSPRTLIADAAPPHSSHTWGRLVARLFAADVSIETLAGAWQVHRLTIEDWLRRELGRRHTEATR